MDCLLVRICWLLTDSRDYATWTNMQENITSTAMSCDYKMVSARSCRVLLG